jgi:hypothetical protein
MPAISANISAEATFTGLLPGQDCQLLAADL